MRAALLISLAFAKVALSGVVPREAVPLCGRDLSNLTSTVTITVAPTAVSVSTNGNADFDSIGAAITYAVANAIPTVSVAAGTYTEAVLVPGNNAVTIVGESSSPDDYSQNQVTITNSGIPMTINTQTTKGVTFKNINFVTTATTSSAYAVYLRGSKLAFYGCQIISAGGQAVGATLSTAIIANSYVEGTDKVFSGYLSMYVYGSTITATNSGAIIVYSKGSTSASTGVTTNSQIAFDSCKLIRKSGLTNTGVYLAAPNNNGAEAIFRYTQMDSFISPLGVHPAYTSYTCFYGEYDNTGAGSYASNAASRSAGDINLSTSQLSGWSIDEIFANSFSGYATTNTSWVDSSVLASIKSADTVVASTSTSSSVSSTITSSASMTSSTVVSNSTISTTASSNVTSTSTTSCPTTGATFTVNPTPSACEYSSVQSAINALPNDSAAKTIVIAAGTYNEQITINRKGLVTLIGETEFPNDFTQNQVTIEFSYGVSTSAGQDELTPVINSKKTDGSGLAVYNINFINLALQQKNYAALAADFYGTNMAVYGCKFVGFQDTFLANKGTQVISNSYIEGSVDFIWGFSAAYFSKCYIAANTAGASICAQSRSSTSDTGGYVFDQSIITSTSTYGTGTTFLGRPYSQYSRVVYMNSYLDSNIDPAGWSVWSSSAPQTSNVTFGEYNNTGPGSSTTSRASFSTVLTADEASAYSLSSFIGDISWIDMDTFNLVPSYSFPNTTTTTTTNTTNSTSSCGHPDSGSVAPDGAVLVSPNGTVAGSYANLTSALAALPSDSTCQTIFMYAGTYDDQVSVNRPGPVRIIGQQSGEPGANYTTNQVILTHSQGLSVSPLPVGHSDAETATFSTASTTISIYNVNIINSANLDGSLASYVTLAGSIYGNQIAFYGCTMIGWQDTLLTGATNGYLYFESSYIEGAIDFIWGYSMAYFKGCTIAAKRKSSAITAHSRASLSAIGGYVFDNCLVTAADGYASDIEGTVFLGRPYNQYARVVYKNSYLDSVIAPAGWKIWSATDPRTDHITFAEFNNTGPGAWESNVDARVAFQNATLLTSDTYTLEEVMSSTSWIDLTYFDSITTPQIQNTTTVTPNATELSSTSPQAGDYVVSKTAIAGLTTYSSISDAIAALPSSSKITPTIFIYPGVYEEQIVFNRSGTTIFRGYTEQSSNNTANQVTIQNTVGVNTQADQSNSDSATFYSRTKGLQMFNLNLENVFGTTHDYASLGFAIGNNGQAAFYGCQIYGNQDTFDLNSGTTVFAYNTMISGTIDFIWGAGTFYCLGCQIVPMYDSGSITADKRATNATAGGMVFDQCTISGTSSAGSVYLGRPYNQYAKVAYAFSYLSDEIAPAGWSVWSSSSPQTDGVLFGEYNNYGPGSDLSQRASFATNLTDVDAAQFQLGSIMTATTWINFTYVTMTPFSVQPIVTLTVPASQPTTIVQTSEVVQTVTSGTSTFTTSLPATTLISTLAASTLTTTRLSTLKETVSTTITVPGQSSTAKTTVTIGSVVTVSPDPVIITKYQTSVDVVTVTSVPAPKTTTVKSTVTSGGTITSTPAAKTVQVTVTSLSTVFSTKTNKPTTITTVDETVTVPGKTSTKAETITSSTVIYSTKTTTHKVTVTATCGAAKRDLQKRTYTITTTVGQSTFTSVLVETTTVTSPFSLATDTIQSTILSTKSLSGATETLTETTTSDVKTKTATISGPATSITLTSTVDLSGTTTLKGTTSTTTLLITSTSTKTATGAASTSTIISYVTKDVVSTVKLATPTVSTTVTKAAKTTVKTTLPASTVTVHKTSTISEASTVITVPVTKLKTVTSKITSTFTSTATKTAKGC